MQSVGIGSTGRWLQVTALLSYAVGRLTAMAGSVEDNPSLLLAVDAVAAILVAQVLPSLCDAPSLCE